MSIKAGDKLPAGTFKVMGKDGPESLTTDQLFKGKTVVLFSVPGAFTPTCDAKHLPGFVEQAANVKAKGVDTIACMAVNDVFVMSAWGKSANATDRVVMLADGSGEYTGKLGMELELTSAGMGLRGKRFALIAKDGVVSKLFVEGAGEFKVSSVEHVLSEL